MLPRISQFVGTATSFICIYIVLFFFRSCKTPVNRITFALVLFTFRVRGTDPVKSIVLENDLGNHNS